MEIRWRTALVSAGFMILILACGNGPTSGDAGETLQVRGRVVEVVGRNILEVESLRIRDTADREWTFTTDGFVGFTPSHIRQHQLLGELVLVSYFKRGDILVAVDVTD